MKRVVTVVLLILSVILVGFSITVRDKLASYQRIEIVPFKNKVGDTFSEAMLADLHLAVLKSLTDSKLLTASFNSDLKFPEGNPQENTHVVFEGTGKDDDNKTLLLLGEIVSFNKGSRTKRYLIGLGGGELRANCFLLDKKTGRQLYNFQPYGEILGGMMGGETYIFYKGLAIRIVKFLKGK